MTSDELSALPLPPTLTTQDRIDLRSIRGGADVFSPALARRLRALKRTHPDLLTITRAGKEYGPEAVHPYFGAILTDDGEEVIAPAPTKAAIGALLDKADKIVRE